MKSYFLLRSVVSLFLVWAEASLTRNAVRVPGACLQLLPGEHSSPSSAIAFPKFLKCVLDV